MSQYERDVRKMNDQFINYEAESAQLADKLSGAKNQLDTVEQEHRELKVWSLHVQIKYHHSIYYVIHCITLNIPYDLHFYARQMNL